MARRTGSETASFGLETMWYAGIDIGLTYTWVCREQEATARNPWFHRRESVVTAGKGIEANCDAEGLRCVPRHRRIFRPLKEMLGEQ